MIYFSSDWHLGEDRIGINGKPNLFFRPFTSIEQQDNTIIQNFKNSSFKDGDTFYHLGDVIYNMNSIHYLEELRNLYPNSIFNLVIGNYDEDKLEILSKYFNIVSPEQFIEIEGIKFYLNHYPINCKEEEKGFGITGHIHGLWKVQKNMINVGVDAWHFFPVSEKEILFTVNAIRKFYDNNVFPY